MEGRSDSEGYDEVEIEEEVKDDNKKEIRKTRMRRGNRQWQEVK